MEPGGRVDQQPEPTERALALDPPDQVVGDRDPFEGRSEYELAGVEHERLAADAVLVDGVSTSSVSAV